MVKKSKQVSQAFIYQLFLGYGNFFITLLSTFILIPIYVNTFGLAEYGIWLTFYSFIGLSAFITINAGSIIVKVITEYLDSFETIILFLSKVKKYYLYNIFLLILFMFLSLYFFIDDAPETTSKKFLIIFSIFIAIINLLNEFLRSILIGSLQIQNFVIFSILGKLMTFILILALLGLKSIIVIPISIFIGELFIFISAALLGRNYLFSHKLSRASNHNTKYSLKTILSNTVGTSSEIFTKNAEFPIISYIFGPDVLAGYSIVRKLADMLSSLATTFLSSTIASLSRLFKEFTKDAIKEIIHDYIFFFIFAASTLMIFFVNILPNFLIFWFNGMPRDILEIDLSIFILFSVFFWYVSNSTFTIFTINGQFIERARLSVFGLFLYLILIFAFVLFFDVTISQIILCHVFTYSILFGVSLIKLRLNILKRTYFITLVFLVYIFLSHYLITLIIDTSFYIGFVQNNLRIGSLVYIGISFFVLVFLFWITVIKVLKLDWVLPNNLGKRE